MQSKKQRPEGRCFVFAWVAITGLATHDREAADKWAGHARILDHGSIITHVELELSGRVRHAQAHHARWFFHPFVPVVFGGTQIPVEFLAGIGSRLDDVSVFYAKYTAGIVFTINSIADD